MNPVRRWMNGIKGESADETLDVPSQGAERDRLGIEIQRKGRFALGILSVFFAQAIFLQAEVAVFNFGLMTWIGQTFFINFTAPGNRMAGVIFLLIGGGLIGTALRIRPPTPTPNAHLRQPVKLLHFLRGSLWILAGAALLMVYLLTQLAQFDRAPGTVLVWLAMIALLLWVAQRYDRQSGARLALRIDRRDVLALVALFGIGLAISSYQITQIPNTYNDDEPEFLYEMKLIAQGQETRSFFAPGVFDFPLASNFWQSIPFFVFGISVWSWRFSSAFSGMLALIPMYMLAREMFSRRTALLAGILLITLPYFIAFNRMGYNNSQALLPTALALYFLYAGLKRHSMLYAALGGVAAGLGFYTYTAGRIGLVIAFFFFGYQVIAPFYRMLRSPRSAPERDEARQRWLNRLALGIVYGGVALMVLLPQIVYANAVLPDLSNPKVYENFLPNVVYARGYFPQEQLFRDYPPFMLGNQTFFFRPDLYLILFMRGLILTVLSFHDSTVANLNFIRGPLTGLISAAFYGIGLVIALRKLRDERYVLLLLWIGCAMFFLSMISTEPPRQTHMVALIPALPILTAIGLISVIDFLSDFDPRPLREWIAQAGQKLALLVPLWSLPHLGKTLLTVGLLGIIIVPNLKNYFVDMPPFYPPELEQIVAWGAINAPVTRTLIFANAFDEPHWRQVTPRLSDLTDLPSKMVKVYIDDFVNGRYRFTPNQEYVIYCLNYDWSKMQRYMRSLPGGALITPIFHTDRGGAVTVVEFTFDAPSDMPPPTATQTQ